MGHPIRELMDHRNAEFLPLEDIVEVDEAHVGGAPKSLSWAYNQPGKGSGKPMNFVAASRDGQARARVASDDKNATLDPVLLKWIDPETTSLMTDGSKSYRGLGKTMADSQYVIHSQKEYAKANGLGTDLDAPNGAPPSQATARSRRRPIRLKPGFCNKARAVTSLPENSDQAAREAVRAMTSLFSSTSAR
ncbi:Transposase [Jannaschia seosinensis]|uniref:Transposase n=1 Tax=Jannaschia seosinensis TaxID=313367 RepID=A0A0M7BB95_9RHOB|nr:transposase [Jannaschia seosinensis]CUH39469.1 Transposase [Jannaschia seosinensis]